MVIRDQMNNQASNSMFQKLIQKIMEAANSHDNLCIIGEVGTGKRQAAVSVHRASGADDGRFSVVNCMALDHENFLSDLFGRVTSDGDLVRKGAVALAEGGTLYLHEVHELSRESQAALVRFLETKTYRPVGGGMSFNANMRLIVSSSATLEALVEVGKFRQDLQHFLTPLIIHMPRLNDRLEDIPTLFKSLIFQILKGSTIRIEQEALVRLKSHNYTGNLLELRNLALRCISSMKNDRITLEDVELAIRGTAYFDLADQNLAGSFTELAQQAGDTNYEAIAAAASPKMLSHDHNQEQDPEDEPSTNHASSTGFEQLNQHMSMNDIVAGAANGETQKTDNLVEQATQTPPKEEDARSPNKPPNLKEVERQYFIDLIDQFEGDKSKVAKAAGLNLRTLYRRLKSLDIE